MGPGVSTIPDRSERKRRVAWVGDRAILSSRTLKRTGRPATRVDLEELDGDRFNPENGKGLAAATPLLFFLFLFLLVAHAAQLLHLHGGRERGTQ